MATVPKIIIWLIVVFILVILTGNSLTIARMPPLASVQVGIKITLFYIAISPVNNCTCNIMPPLYTNRVTSKNNNMQEFINQPTTEFGTGEREYPKTKKVVDDWVDTLEEYNS